MPWLSQLRQHLAACGDQDCILCGTAADRAGGNVLCSRCDISLPASTAENCPQCAISSPRGLPCGDCVADPPAFDDALAAFRYRFPLDQLLLSYKYSANLALSAFFARKLVLALRSRGAPLPECIVPMPLSARRLAERGFNQAALIADGLAASFSLPMNRVALERIRETRPQTTLPWKARRDNVKGAFAATSALQGKHVALVDDVMTTGATLNEAARALKKQGVARVSAWIVARAEKELATAGWETETLLPHV